MIYEFRPLSCRQYFVTTNRCGGIGHTEKLISPVNLSQILSLTTSRLTKTAPQAIMLPLIFAWQQENQHLFEKHYPSKEMAGIFVETLCNTEHITV
jgi:Fe-S-cluster containining protein